MIEVMECNGCVIKFTVGIERGDKIVLYMEHGKIWQKWLDYEYWQLNNVQCDKNIEILFATK